MSEKTDATCPKCGETATYRTPDGVFWDSNAHHWKPSIRIDPSPPSSLDPDDNDGQGNPF